MWLFWPVVFGVFGFGSVAYSGEAEKIPTLSSNGKSLYDGFSVNLNKKDLIPNNTESSGDESDETSGSGDGPDETSDDEPTDGKPASEDKPDDTPKLEIISGFDVATGTLGSGIAKANGTGIVVQPPGSESFNAATGTLGWGVANQNTSVKALTLQEAIPCYDKSPEPKITFRGDWWIFHNYVPMSTKVRCWESVTFVTHARWFEMIHIVPLVERWRAPISVAVETRNDNFEKTLDSIRYVKSCTSPLVSQYVTFHLYFSKDDIPDDILDAKMILSVPYPCGLPPTLEITSEADWETEALRNEYYPNVGRNIAKENALTHYHMVADISFYPSANLASDFVEMIRRNDQPETSTPNPRVFVVPPFQVLEGEEAAPFNKTELIKMLNEGKAIPFPDTDRCPLCQNMPEAAAWRSTPESDALGIHFVGKRTGPFKSWEPIFIGTDKDPMYFEQFSEEATYDKRAHAWLLCVLDYDFPILNNAFVVRPPGQKKLKIYENVREDMDDFILADLMRQYRRIYAENRACAL